MSEQLLQPAIKALQPILFLYGPPGAGKSTMGSILAADLGIPFLDLDQAIENRSGKSIPEIFDAEGEPGFRARERATLEEVLSHQSCVVALGGGALLDAESRRLVESRGPVICLTAAFETLLGRVNATMVQRPLLAGDQAAGLRDLFARRKDHYASFPYQVDTSGLSPEQAAWETQVHFGIFHVRGMGNDYDVRVIDAGRNMAGELIQSLELIGPLVLVSDENVGKLYGEEIKANLLDAGFRVRVVLIPPGEEQKTIGTVGQLWDAFLSAGLERSSAAATLGGGVVSDLGGFAAATYHRGIPWVALPTTLLAMVDASLGGKTGIDLPQGKNLVGAFHPPRMVLVDPGFLVTLPEAELRSGMAEVVKHGMIGDPVLFESCVRGWDALRENWTSVVSRAIGVKVKIIQADPYEKGLRATLNFGHTVGHAVESSSGYRLRHGEAIAIGMVAETRLAERIGLARPGLAERLASVLAGLGLPIDVPVDMDRIAINLAMEKDKKRRGGRLRFALPLDIGDVRAGVEIPGMETIF